MAYGPVKARSELVWPTKGSVGGVAETSRRFQMASPAFEQSRSQPDARVRRGRIHAQGDEARGRRSRARERCSRSRRAGAPAAPRRKRAQARAPGPGRGHASDRTEVMSWVLDWVDGRAMRRACRGGFSWPQHTRFRSWRVSERRVVWPAVCARPHRGQAPDSVDWRYSTNAERPTISITRTRASFPSASARCISSLRRNGNAPVRSLLTAMSVV